jgi:hypothetical protein
MQDPGERSSEDEEVYPKVLSDEDAIAGYLITNSGTLLSRSRGIDTLIAANRPSGVTSK